MNNNTRKIVVLNKLNSPRIEQAIFILRDEANITENDAVSEAQKIVDNYLRSLSGAQDKKKKRKLNCSFLIGITVYTFLTSVVTAYILSFAG